VASLFLSTNFKNILLHIALKYLANISTDSDSSLLGIYQLVCGVSSMGYGCVLPSIISPEFGKKSEVLNGGPTICPVLTPSFHCQHVRRFAFKCGRPSSRPERRRYF